MENQKLKLLTLVDMFYKETDEEHGITIAEMIQYLKHNGTGAERKSLYNDIDNLKEYGMDITSERIGKDTYYKLVSRDFELAELKLLVDAVQSSRFITAGKSEILIRKLENLASKYEALELQRQVYVINRIKNSNERIFINIDLLHRAIHDRVQVEFDYAVWNSEKKLVSKHPGKIYKVSPAGLIWDDENYYLVGFDEDEKKVKHFRVDKLLSLTLSLNPIGKCTELQSFNPAIYSEKHFGMYGGQLANVKFRMKEYLIGVMIDRFGQGIMLHPDRTDSSYAIVSVEVAVSNQFYGWVVGLGSDVEILEPASVRDGLADTLKRIGGMYK